MSQSTRNSLGFAVIGAGRIGALHAAHLGGEIEHAHLVAVVDPMVDAARRAARQAKATDDVGSIFNDDSIDAVLIASPTDKHAEQIIAAARAGKAIFCEKPVSLDLAAASEAMAAVEAARVPFQIGFQRRYDPAFLAAHQRLQDGAIGHLEMLRALACDPQPSSIDYLRGSGGIYADMTIHDIDLARYYAGDIVEVTAMGAVNVVPELKDLGDVDTSILTLRFENGAIGVIQNSRRMVYGYDIRTELQGSRGKLVVEEERATSLWQYDDKGIHGDYHDWFLERFRRAYRLELQAFVSAVLADREPTPGPRDAIESLRVALAATKSLREKRSVLVNEIQAAAPASR
jgi:myo-inositol 2-dehydrogenase/D-chiro-inositol 1-dehydrogenase